MIDFELFSKIKHYHEQRALTPAQIARELELDPRTVAKWLAEHRFLPRKSTKRSSKLDPFKTSILRMLETHPYSAVQILQRIRDEGFDGGYTILKDYVRRVRPPGGDRRSSNWHSLQASALRSTGALTAPLPSVIPAAGSVSLSWSYATAA